MTRCLDENPNLLKDELLLRKKEWNDLSKKFKTLVLPYSKTLVKYKIYPILCGFKESNIRDTKKIVDKFLNPLEENILTDSYGTLYLVYGDAEDYFTSLGVTSESDSRYNSINTELVENLTPVLDKLEKEVIALINKNKYKCIGGVPYEGDKWELMLTVNLQPSSEFEEILRKYF